MKTRFLPLRQGCKQRLSASVTSGSLYRAPLDKLVLIGSLRSAGETPVVSAGFLALVLPSPLYTQEQFCSKGGRHTHEIVGVSAVSVDDVSPSLSCGAAVV